MSFGSGLQRARNPLMPFPLFLCDAYYSVDIMYLYSFDRSVFVVVVVVGVVVGVVVLGGY